MTHIEVRKLNLFSLFINHLFCGEKCICGALIGPDSINE